MAVETAILGKVRSTPRGEYDSTIAYEIMDRVYVSGKTYEALKDTPAGTAVTDTTYWVLMADNDVALQDIITRTTNLESEVDTIQGSIGSDNGLAELDSNGTLVSTQIPSSITNHISNTVIHVTANDKTNWNAAYTFISGDQIPNMIADAFTFESTTITDTPEDNPIIEEDNDPETSVPGDGDDDDGAVDIDTETGEESP